MPVLPAQANVLPVIAPGAPGIETTGVTFRLVAVLLPQSFCAVTFIVPPTVPTLTVIDAVPWPDVMVQPVGTVQL